MQNWPALKTCDIRLWYLQFDQSWDYISQICSLGQFVIFYDPKVFDYQIKIWMNCDSGQVWDMARSVNFWNGRISHNILWMSPIFVLIDLSDLFHYKFRNWCHFSSISRFLFKGGFTWRNLSKCAGLAPDTSLFLLLGI